MDIQEVEWAVVIMAVGVSRDGTVWSGCCGTLSCLGSVSSLEG